METKLDYVTQAVVEIKTACDYIENLNALEDIDRIVKAGIENRIEVIKLLANQIKEIVERCQPSED